MTFSLHSIIKKSMRSMHPKIPSILFFVFFSLSAQSLQITDFKSPSITCDYLVVCPDELLSCGTRLAAHRNGSLFDDVENAMAVSLSTIMQEFSVDDTCPRAFSTWYALKYAAEKWNVKPAYVVLLGDDSVSCLDNLSPRYIDDSIIASFESAATGGRIDVTIPSAIIAANTHYTLYVWNDRADGRLDTLIPLTSPVIANNAKSRTMPSFTFSRGILAISLPASAQSAKVQLSLFALNGARIENITLPVNNGNAVLDLQKRKLPKGSYIFRITKGEIPLSGKLCFVQ